MTDATTKVTRPAKFTPESQLDDWFGYHPPSSPEIADAHETVRAACRQLAQVLSDLLPESPDKTVALRAVREVMYHAQRLHEDTHTADGAQ